MKFFLMLFAINLFGFVKYVDYSIKEVSYRKQMLTDFFCPIGSFLGRLIFRFKMKENASGYIFGFLLEVFITILFFSIF